MQETNFESLQENLNELGSFSLETAKKKIPYNEKDLANVTFIFLSVVSSLSYNLLEKSLDMKNLSEEQKKMLEDWWHNMWTDLRKYVHEYTWYDLHDVCKKENTETI